MKYDPPQNLLSVLGMMLWGMAGCGGRVENPSFPLTRAHARRDLREMQRRPLRLSRPVVVLGGWCDPTRASGHIRATLASATGDRRLIAVSFCTAPSFAVCRRRVICAVERSFPNDDPTWTTEVDVVGFSMGGLVARLAAARGNDRASQGKRLRIARLFTISTPHRGAWAAPLVKLGALARDMRPGSDFLRQLDGAGENPAYEIVPYVRLHDAPVGCGNTAPAGRLAWWVDSPPFSAPHAQAFKDPRILADIARRLRGEKPFTLDPPAALPGSLPASRHSAGQSASGGQSQTPAPSP